MTIGTVLIAFYAASRLLCSTIERRMIAKLPASTHKSMLFQWLVVFSF